MNVFAEVGRKLRLPNAEAALLACLLEHERPSQATLMAALRRSGSRAVDMRNCLFVRISNLRGVLRRRGVQLDVVLADGRAISTDVRGIGPVAAAYYQLSPAGRACLLELATDDSVGLQDVDPAWDLTPAEASVARALLRASDAIKADGILAALNADGFKARQEAVVKVHICRIRPRLRAAGFVIESHYRQGYRIVCAPPGAPTR